MALFTLSRVISTVYGSIACCISCRSCDGDNQGHDHRYQASSSRSSYSTITTQPTYQPHPLPSYARDSYGSTIKNPTVSDRERNLSRLNRNSPPHGGPCPRVTSHVAPLAVRAFTFPCRLFSALSPLPLAIRSLRCLPHPIDVKPYTAMLRCLLWVSCQMSPSCCLITTPLRICGKRPDI